MNNTFIINIYTVYFSYSRNDTIAIAVDTSDICIFNPLRQSCHISSLHRPLPYSIIHNNSGSSPITVSHDQFYLLKIHLVHFQKFPCQWTFPVPGHLTVSLIYYELLFHKSLQSVVERLCLQSICQMTVLSRTPGRARQAPGVWDRFIPA